MPFDYTLGDVVICVAIAAKSAARLGQSLAREVCFLLVHGILHLCGYDHQQPRDAAIMFAEQQRIMQAVGKKVWRGCVVLHDGRRV